MMSLMHGGRAICTIKWVYSFHHTINMSPCVTVSFLQIIGTLIYSFLHQQKIMCRMQEWKSRASSNKVWQEDLWTITTATMAVDYSKTCYLSFFLAFTLNVFKHVL